MIYAAGMYYDRQYYVMKRAAQQRLAQGDDLAAILLMQDLKAWWGCPNKARAPATDIWRSARRLYRRLPISAR